MSDSSQEIELMIEASAADPLIGVTLKGKYLIIDLLGRGGMGAVYRAEDVQLHRTVAVKVVNDILKRCDRELCVERFKREARVGSKLNSQYIVQVFDFDTTDDGLEYIVMEYVPHRTLSEYLDDFLYLQPKKAVMIISQVLLALEACRREDVVHRDLKPQNILLKETSSGLEVKICDFGLGKLSSDRKNLTTSGVLVGTPKYMSPEQCRGVDTEHRSDIYSVGVVLYETLTGRAPFEGSSATVIHRHLSADPPPMKQREDSGHKIPSALAEVVKKAMRKNPEERYRTSGEMRVDMLGALRKPAHSQTTPNARKMLRVLPWLGAVLSAVVFIAAGMFGYKALSSKDDGSAARTLVAMTEKSESERKPVQKQLVTPVVSEELMATPLKTETLPDTRNPGELLRLADRYSMQGKTALMAEAYERFLKVCGKRHPRKRYVRKRLQAYRLSQR